MHRPRKHVKGALGFTLVALALGLFVQCGNTVDFGGADDLSDGGSEAAPESGARRATDAAGSRDAKGADATSRDAPAEAAVDGPRMDAEGGDATVFCGAGTCDAGQVCVTFSGSLGGPGDPGSPAGSSSSCADVPSSCTDYCKCQSICEPDSSLVVCNASGFYIKCESIAP
jgi:hypothetical protein